MATGAELMADVRRIVREGSAFTDAEILSFFNRCASHVSSLYILPSLDTSSEVTTSGTPGATVAMPTDYQRNLYMAIGARGNLLSIIDSIKHIAGIVRGDMSATGSRVEMVAAVGSVLRSWPTVEATETITLFYQKKPDEITTSGAVSLFSGSPGEGHPILVNYAAWKMFEEIEQGGDGAKVDALYHMGLFDKALIDLERWLKNGSGVSMVGPRFVRSSW